MLFDYLFYGAIVVLVITMLLILFFSILPVRASKKIILIMWQSIFISLAIIVFFAEPFVSEDLFSHYADIDALRWGRDISTPLIVWKGLLKIISRTEYDGFLPAFNMLLIGYVTKKILKDNIEKGIRVRYLLVCVCVFFGGCHMAAIVSGVRTAMSFAIWMYVYYFYYQKRKDVYWIGVVIGMLIHPVAVWPAILLELYKKMASKGTFFKIIVLVLLSTWVYIAKLVFTSLSFTNISYLRLLSSKFNSYLEYSLTDSGWRLLAVVGAVLLLVFTGMISKEINDQDSKDYIGFFQLMLFFDIVSCFTYPAFMDRMAVVISFLALPIVCGKYRCTYGGKIILTATTVVYALLLIYYLNALVSHETFYGVDFYKILWSFVPS